MVSNHHPLVFQTSATDRVSYRPKVVPNRIELLLSAYQTDFLPLEDGTISGQGWTRTNDVSLSRFYRPLPSPLGYLPKYQWGLVRNGLPQATIIGWLSLFTAAQ